MDVPDPIWLFVTPLNEVGIPYAVTGATAAILYGAPRLTNDLDLVLRLSREAAMKLRSLFPEPDFYLPPEDIVEVERCRPSRGHFNIIHLPTGYKADVYLSGTDPLHAWAFRHVNRVELSAGTVSVAPPEYVIVRKLEFYREGGSEKHLNDIRSVLSANLPRIDRAFLDQQIHERGLSDTWNIAAENDERSGKN